MCVFFLLSIHTKYSSEPFLLCESVMAVRKRRITSWDRIPDQTRVPVPYFQAITSLQFYVDTLNYFQRWNPKYSFQLEKRKENTLRSLILAFPKYLATQLNQPEIQALAIITTKGSLSAILNLTRPCCSRTLIIRSLFCVKNSAAQPSSTDGIHHWNPVRVFVHVSTFSGAESSGLFLLCCAFSWFNLRQTPEMAPWLQSLVTSEPIKQTEEVQFPSN